MCPASSQKKGKRSRYYRCSTRDKLGKEVCAAKELPADAIEQYVVARLTESTLDTTFTSYVDTLIHKRIESERAALLKVRADLPSRIAQHAADASKLTEELPRLSGRAQQIVH